MPLTLEPKRPPLWRRMLNACLALGFGLLLTVGLLELGLRFMPVRDNLDANEPVTKDAPIKRFKRNAELNYSKGFNFSLANKLRTNNVGFVNDQDYVPEGGDPLVAVIGDSYVMAVMLPYAQTLQGRLANELTGRVRVYSFGANGAPLSQYLAYAKYARENFYPRGMVIVIVGNDFDESLMRYKSHPGFHYFKETQSGELELELVEYRPVHQSWLHELGAALHLGESALVRYIRTNLPMLLAQWKSDSNKDAMKDFVGQTAAKADPERLAFSKRGVDRFLALIPEYSGLEREDVLFVLDGMRPHLYDDAHFAAAQTSYFALMRSYFIEQATEKGHEVIDMQPLFRIQHATDGARFEYPNDGHWNAAGHAAAATAVGSSKLVQRLGQEGE